MQVYSYPERGFQKNNTNALLGIIPNVDGIKTGYTGNAGYCLAFSMVVDKDKQNEIIKSTKKTNDSTNNSTTINKRKFTFTPINIKSNKK